MGSIKVSLRKKGLDGVLFFPFNVTESVMGAPNRVSNADTEWSETGNGEQPKHKTF